MDGTKRIGGGLGVYPLQPSLRPEELFLGYLYHPCQITASQEIPYEYDAPWRDANRIVREKLVLRALDSSGIIPPYTLYTTTCMVFCPLQGVRWQTILAQDASLACPPLASIWAFFSCNEVVRDFVAHLRELHLKTKV